MTVMFDTVRECRLRAFWPTIEPLLVLAKEWGCSAAYISIQPKRLGLPSRKFRGVEIRRAMFDAKFRDRVECNYYLTDEAKRRGLNLRQLEALLIATISNDRLVGAVLDDAAEVKAAA